MTVNIILVNNFLWDNLHRNNVNKKCIRFKNEGLNKAIL